MCACPPGYTGQFCEIKLDSYQLQVTIDFVSNPEGRCAGEGCIFAVIEAHAQQVTAATTFTTAKELWGLQ